MATEQESFELQGYHNPLALKLEELEGQELPTTVQQFPVTGKTNDDYGDLVQERKLTFKNKSSRRWKILTAVMGVIAVGCLVAFIYVLVANPSGDEASSGQTGNRVGATKPEQKPTTPTPDIQSKQPEGTTSRSETTRPEATRKSPTVGDTRSKQPETMAPRHETSQPEPTRKLPTSQTAQRTRTTASATTDSETLTVAPSTPPPANIGFLPAIFGVSLPVVQAGSQSYVKMKLPVSSRSTVGLTLLAEAVGNPELAVYWREGTEPTHTRYNFTEAFGQAANQMQKIKFTATKVLESGMWFVTIFNGGSTNVQLNITFTQSAPPKVCPNDCSGRGTCFDGVCGCHPKWKGKDCSEANCAVADCSGNGQCVNGVCLCSAGWMGYDCSEVDCIPSDCSGNGLCDIGVCSCAAGYRGSGCEIAPVLCPGDCSGRGLCDTVNGQCTCVSGWSGLDCNSALCDYDCRGHGTCDNGTCLCNPGWTGLTCDLLECPTGCETHGTCDNGTCLCDKGWRDSDCLTDACPNNCTVHGSCLLGADGVWGCVCGTGFRGQGCEIGVELACDDGVDNDGDQLIDCDDPDCCNSTVCINDDSCSSSPDPSDLVGNTTANTTLSFYDTIDFLFTSGLQMEVDLTAIDRTRVAVVKGNVATRDTTPLPGATVTVLGQTGLGYTLTRQDGSYDIACNGGGAVTLQYTRRNFIGAQRSVTVPWNDYISVADVAMIPVDNKVTEIDLSSGDDVKVAAGSPTEDEDGKRQGVLMFPPDTEALIVNRNGTGNTSVVKPMIRVTEYTVGSRGEEAMPAELPAFTGYTYAVEMSVDQAAVNGSTEVVFNKPVSYFVENYLGFPVGSAVPAGFYNRTLGEWVAAPNGRVIQVLNVTVVGGKRLAVIDVTGDGVAATVEELDDLGVTDKELERIAAQYNVTQTLWRVPVRHFTPWDCNWPYGPPLDGCTPYQCNAQEKPINGPSKQLDPRDPYKVVIGDVTIIPETGVISLRVLIPGSLFSLFYFNNRVPAYRPVVVIPLTAASLPGSLKRVHLRIRVRGRDYVRLFPPQTNMEYRFSWDGRDAYNRVVHGTVPCTVNIGYEYQLVYYSVRSRWRQSFNRISNADVNWQVRRGNRKVVFWEKRVTEIGTSDGPSEVTGLGGWSLNVHHSYDPGSGILQMGDGRKINFKDKSKVVTTVVGDGNRRPEVCPDCVPSVQGTATSLRAAAVLATANDGSVFMGDYQLIRRYYTDGNVSTVVDLGNRPPSYSFYMAVSPLDGDLFISYAPLSQIIRIRADLLNPGQPVVTLNDLGTKPGVTVFAGNGQLCRPWDFDCGDNGLAVDAKLTAPKGIAVGPRGTVYFIDGKLIRQVGGDGLINVFAGSRVPRGCAPPGCCVESTGNVPLDQAYFGWPTDLSLKSDDESLYVIDRNNVYHILREGQVRVAAGRAPHIPPQPSPTQQQQQQQDDFVPKPALQVDLKPLRGLAVSGSGTIFFAETDMAGTNRIRYVAQSGSMVTFAGSNSGCRCFSGDGEAASKAQFYVPSAVILSPEEDILYIADQRNLRVRMVRVSLPRLSTTGFYAIPSPDGSSFFSFDFSGRHRFTVLTATSEIIHTFNYDDFGLLGSANGRLTEVTDAFNNTLRIERHPDGRPTGFVTENGLKSAVTVDSNGYLSSLENNRGRPVKFAYHASGGLLASRTSPSGLIQSFSYDDSGRLSKFVRPDGGFTQLSRVKNDEQFYAHVTGNSGHRTTVDTSETGQAVTRPYGGKTISTDLADGTRRVLYADGVTLEEETTKDAVWGEQLSAVSKMKVTLPSGLTKTLESNSYATFTQLLNPVSLTKFGRTLRVNNKDWVKVDFDKLTLTKTIKSLESSDALKLTYRKSGLLRSLSVVNSGLSPVSLSYDDNERVTSISQGDVELIYKYDSLNRLVEKRIDGEGAVRYGYNGNRYQPESLVLPSGQKFNFTYDADGNLASVTTPKGSTYSFKRTVTRGNTSHTYTLPGGSLSFSQDYNTDGDRVSTRLPSGLRSFSYTPDNVGRLGQIQYDDTVVEIGYSDDTDRVTDIRRLKKSDDSLDSVIIGVSFSDFGGYADDTAITANGEAITKYSYDGPYLIRNVQTVTSDIGVTASMKFEYSYDAYFRHLQRTATLNSQSAVRESRQYSTGKLTAFGRYSVTYLTSTQTRIYYSSYFQLNTKHDGNGRLAERTLLVRGNTVFSLKLSYDNASRVMTKQITVRTGGSLVAKQYRYAYDQDGRLTGVWHDGKQEEKYTYDKNGNKEGWGGIGNQTRYTASFDTADRVKRAGSTIYRWDADGFLSQKGSYLYEYTARGELLSVKDTKMSQLVVSFTYDGVGRRVSRTDHVSSQGIQTTVYFYGDLSDPYRVTHVVTNSGTQRTTLRYDLEGNLFAIEGSNTRYVGTDEQGTPVALFDSSNGKIIKQVTYNAFGERLSDSNSNEMFYVGFGGGLFDPTTTFVRTSAGDYDPLSGQMASSDPTQTDFSSVNTLVCAMRPIRPLADIESHSYELSSPTISDHVLNWAGKGDRLVLPTGTGFRSNQDDGTDCHELETFPKGGGSKPCMDECKRWVDVNINLYMECVMRCKLKMSCFCPH